MKLDKLPQDIQDAARALADAILADPQAEAYRSALTDFEQDTEVIALEKRFRELYVELIVRQQGGEILSCERTSPFYDLRSEYYAHPRVVARNDALSALKPLLADALDQISAHLSLDFAGLVGPPSERCSITRPS